MLHQKKQQDSLAVINKSRNFAPDLVRGGRKSEGRDAIHLAEKTV